jgi:hypothetical protein
VIVATARRDGVTPDGASIAVGAAGVEPSLTATVTLA